MNKIFRATCLSILGLAAASGGFLACSSNSATGNDGGTTGDGGPGGEGGGGEGGGGDGGGPTTPTGSISVNQTSSLNFYTVSAGFNNRVAGDPTSTGTACTKTTVGMCTALVCTFATPAADAGTTMPPAPKPELNAGNITVTGMGDAGAAVLTYGPIGDAGYAGYRALNASGRFFKPGDTIRAVGAGGPDLPAFGAQTVVAPGDITLTSPACAASSCPPLDRTMDLAVTWTGGGAGDLIAELSTISDTTSATILCTFNAAGGTGSISKTLLSKLEKAGDPNITGIEVFAPTNAGASFNVGAAATKFAVQGEGAEGTMTVSN